MPPLILPVAPIASQRAQALICRSDGTSAVESFDEPVYPASARNGGGELRRARVEVGRYRTVREAAALLGLSAARVSDLEEGRAVFAHDSDRRAYLAALGAP